MSEVIVPLGPVASAFSAFGLASSDIALSAELSDPTIVPFDPDRAEQNFAELEKLVREGLDRQGVRYEAVELYREIDMRYTMQLAEVTAPVAGGPLDMAAIEAAATAFEQQYATLYGADTGFREAGIQAITFRVRGVGVLPFSPALPEIGTASSPTRPTPDRNPSGLPGRRPGLRGHAGLRLPQAAGRAPADRPGHRRGADHHRRDPRRHHRHRGQSRQPGHAARPARGQPHR